jgi:hypothetical protein
MPGQASARRPIINAEKALRHIGGDGTKVVMAGLVLAIHTLMPGKGPGMTKCD